MIRTTATATEPSAMPACAPVDSLPIALRSMFWRPDYLEPSAWTEHLPFAFWLMEAQRPRTFVELGSHHGTSYFAFCQAAGRLGLDVRCYAVDTWRGDEHAGFYDERVYNKVRSYNDAHYSGFSTLVRSTFDEAAQHFGDGTIDLLHIDGLHTFEAVSHDFACWLPRLSERAVVILHDINVRERGFGVFELFEKLRGTYPCFEFVHGHGLGVVGVGAKQAELMARLFESSGTADDCAAIREAFSRMGRACGDAFALKELRTRALDSEEQLFRRKNEIAVLAEKLAKAEASVEARFKETANLTRMLLDLERADAASKQSIALHERNIRACEASLKQARAEHDRAVQQFAAREQKAQAAHAAAIAQAARRHRGEMLDGEWALAQANATRATLEQQLTALREEHARLSSSLSWKLTAPLRRLRSPRVAARAELSAASAELELLRGSDLFDRHWYLRKYPDVASNGIDPVEHYLSHGAAEGRDPGPRFNSNAYMRSYPGVREAGINPLVHYLRHGFKEGRTVLPAEPDQE